MDKYGNKVEAHVLEQEVIVFATEYDDWCLGRNYSENSWE